MIRQFMLSSLELPLPEPGQIEIPAEAFALSDADAPGTLTAAGSNTGEGSSFFSEGTIGAGTSAHISGDINLYHIGEQPDFRLRFFHDSLDGFSGSVAGEGYSSREELIEAELNYSDDSISSDILARYNEFEDGLQENRGDYYTVTRRSPELESDLNWQFADLFALTGGLDASLDNLLLNGAAPLSFYLFSVKPEAGIIFGKEDLNLGLTFKYAVAGHGDGGSPVQQLGGALSFVAEPASIIHINGEVELLWSNYNALYFPFEIGLSGSSLIFEYELTGGYSAEYFDRSDAWGIFPSAAGPVSAASLGSLPLTTGWYIDGGLSWNLSDRLSFRASAGFSSMVNAVMPSASSLNGFNSLTATDSNCLDAGAGLYMKITEGLNFSADWSGQLLSDLDWFRPRHELTGEFELTSADKNLGLTGNLAFNIYDENQTWFVNDWIPAVGLEAYLRLSEGFVLSVSGSDLAAGLVEGGRNLWNGYLDKGTMFQAMIKISL